MGQPEVPASAETEGAEAAEQKVVFQLRLSDNRMTAYITAALYPERRNELVLLTTKELEKLGIIGAVQHEQVTKRLDEAFAQGVSEITDYVLLQGTPPTPPKEGQMVWADDFFNAGFAVDPATGAADYRRRLGRLSVAEGELLATMVPPEPGIDGRDLMGKAVQTAKMKQFRVRAGTNVRFDEAEGTFYATKDGRIRFNGTVLSIDDVFTISGSVNLKTGHIKHPGALVVSLNIESDSRVEAEGDIEVSGLVENAEIITRGVLTVHGGITGGAKCRIHAEGGIHARFIRNAVITSNGDVVAEHEIDQCNLKTCGAVNVVHGRIVACDVVALGGIEADQVGSEAYVRTNLSAGEDYTLKDQVTEREAEIEKNRDALRKIAERLAPLTDKKKMHLLPPKLRNMATTLLTDASKLNQSIQAKEEELETIRANSRARMKKEIVIRREIFPDAFFYLHPLHMLVKDHVDGPIKFAIIDGDLRMVYTRAH
jgi:uncharacterized protein